MEDMLKGQHGCVWHQGQQQPCACLGVVEELVERGDGISLGVTGSPCNPFSTIRTKRFHDGSVVDHSMTLTTMDSVVQFYKKFEPRCGITEQVKGFGMRLSSSVSTTPLDMFLGLADQKNIIILIIYYTFSIFTI